MEFDWPFFVILTVGKDPEAALLVRQETLTGSPERILPYGQDDKNQ